jgi:hypothetical protein
MIDKKVLLLIGALVIVALVILAVSLVMPGSTRASGSSFSALFDKMENKTGTSSELVLPEESYTAGQVITVTDRIIAMDVDDYHLSTTLYFIYEGSKWINENTGSSFDVLQDVEKIRVKNSVFHLTLGTDLSVKYDVGGSISLQVGVTLSHGDLVLGHIWTLA